MKINNLDIRDNPEGGRDVYVDGHRIENVGSVTIDFRHDHFDEITIRIRAMVEEDGE